MRIESAVHRPGMRAHRAERALAGRNRIRHLDPKAAACVVGPALQVACVGSRDCNALQEPVGSVSRTERHAWSGAREGPPDIQPVNSCCGCRTVIGPSHRSCQSSRSASAAHFAYPWRSATLDESE